jgi:hypothetical protein
VTVTPTAVRLVIARNLPGFGPGARSLPRNALSGRDVRPRVRAWAQQLGTAWANFDDQLTHHHEGEHTTAWPALLAVGVSKELLATLDAEHETMAAALAETRTAMGALTRTAGPEESKAALAAFQKLQAVTTQHFDHEESETEDVLIAKRDTAEIEAMHKAFAKMSPPRGGRFLAWMLDGASPDERGTVTRNVPGPVISIIGGIFGRGYRKNVAPVWKS